MNYQRINSLSVSKRKYRSTFRISLLQKPIFLILYTQCAGITTIAHLQNSQ